MVQKPLEAWDALLREAVSHREDDRENALFLIGLILERHHQPNNDAPDLYETNLSRELLRLVLAEERVQAATVYLAKLVETEAEAAASALYAMRRATPALFAAPLLQVIRSHGPRLNISASYEAVQGLLTLLKQPPSDLKALLHTYDPRAVVDAWIDSPNDELADKADWALAKIEPYFEDDEPHA